ncbi:MAG TPA: hypothetical protein DCE08_00885 [Ruminococcaceae bacterium]|nr:hypothetical protein [Oscillospiraceae bacterium]
MNAIGFYKKFKTETTEEKQNEDGRSYFEIYQTDEPAFTNLVNKKIIHKIIKESGLEVQHEYFRIDSVGWFGKYQTLDRKQSEEVGMNRHLWDLKIAVEHENNKKDWLDEVIKLVHVKCPLKVVIGYNYCDCRGEAEEKKLQYVSGCMQQVDAFYLGENEEYLIILGNGAPKDKTNGGYKSFDYRAYLYSREKKRFVKI